MGARELAFLLRNPRIFERRLRFAQSPGKLSCLQNLVFVVWSKLTQFWPGPKQLITNNMSSSIPLSADQRAARVGAVARVGVFIVAGLIFAPFALAAIGGMLGLIVGGAIASFTWFMLPVVEQKATNLRLAMIKAEAARHPIETLQFEYLRRSLILKDRESAIQTFAKKCGTFGDKVEGFKKTYPAEAQKYQDMYDKMRKLLALRRTQWQQASQQLNDFDAEIQKASDMWEMAKAADAAQAASDLDSGAFYAKLKTATAFSSIQDEMNGAFAQLDTLEMESNAIEINVTPAPTALPAPSGSTVDVAPAAQAAPVRSHKHD